MEDVIVAIDIGTSKVCTLIGQANKENVIEILGKGLEPLSGVKKGVIVDIESTSNSIKASVRQAEEMSNLKVGSAYVNILGANVSVIDHRSSIQISNEGEITEKDVQRVLYNVKNISIPEDREIIDIIPRQYIVDEYDEIIDPVGMMGTKLEADLDIIAGKNTSVQNIVKSLEKAEIITDGIIVEALATGEAVLTQEEKELGVILIDVGGGITDISVFKNKRLFFCDSIPLGGDHISNDISIGLKIPYAEAEKVKRQYELALTSLIKNDQEVTVSDINDNKKKTVKVSEIVEIIEARVYEIFSLAKELLERSGIDDAMNSGIVLTGGGISYVDGGMQLAYEVFDKPVRIATYKVIGATKPEFTTSIGIMKYILSRSKGNKVSCEVKEKEKKNIKKERSFFKKITEFFSGFF
ncbi:MAG: cell division protein FtsA [Clostridia bacterium]|nr:cell division protein FtsA [Clostridia bacterium]